MPNLNLATINRSYSPPHFVTDGDFAFYVEGYTSDNPNDWRLMAALVDSKGRPDMSTASPANDNDWPGFPRVYSDMLNSRGLLWLLGNTLRACQGIQSVGVWL